jgi:CRISPR-associated protein Csm2
MVSDIYNDVLTEQDEVLNDEIRGKIAYLKVRLIYECGREPNIVKPFVELAGLLDIISGIGYSRQRFIDFEHYMEALVAYHRFHEGKD